MYEIYYKDICTFRISDKGGKIEIVNSKYLPFDIFVEESDDVDDRANNIVNFNSWCSGRILPLDRQYAKEILNYFGFSQRLTDKERAKIGITTRCLSLNDCYWLKRDTETLKWKDVNLFENSLDNAIFDVALTGKSMTLSRTEVTNPDIATDGKAPKAWVRKGKDFFLLKGDKDDSVKREVEASIILKKLGIDNVGYEYDEFNGQIVSKCKCFTSERTNLVRAEWFNIWCMNHDSNIQDYIVRCKEDFDKMNLADFLIGNTDEHPENWGFIYNNDMEILGINPLMDFDHAFLGSLNEICAPAYFMGQRILQKEYAINVVRQHPDWIDFNADLSEFKYGAFVKERLKVLISNLY